MARPRVVVTHWVHPEIVEALGREAVVVANETRQSLPRSELLQRARDARAILAFMPDLIDEEFLDYCPSLGIVAGAFKGYDNVNVRACLARGIFVTVVPDLLAEPTAELAVALVLSLCRRVPEGDRVVRSGEFRGWRPILFAPGLAGRTLGIVGMGAVGQSIAARLGGFCLRLLYHDRRALSREKERELKVTPASLEELLATSDHVVLALPLTSQTRSLIDIQALMKMKPGATLVNVGRGSVVDEEAVASALASGRLGGYAADVFACEDVSLPDRPREIPGRLLASDSTVFTPHIGSAVDEVRLAIARSAAGSILDFLRGMRPKHAVNLVLEFADSRPPRMGAPGA